MKYEIMGERTPVIVKWKDLDDDVVAIPPSRWVDTRLEKFKYKGKNCEAVNFIFESLDDGTRYKASNALLKYILENDYEMGECLTVDYEGLDDQGRPKIKVKAVKVAGEEFASKTKDSVEPKEAVAKEETQVEVESSGDDELDDMLKD